VRAAPGAEDLLSTLKQLRLPWAVVNSDARLAALRLHAAGIAGLADLRDRLRWAAD
jgi:hypothetical protein